MYAQENRKTVSPDKYEQLVRPYLSTPISDRGTLALSSSYAKLLPIVTQVGQSVLNTAVLMSIDKIAYTNKNSSDTVKP